MPKEDKEVAVAIFFGLTNLEACNAKVFLPSGMLVALLTVGLFPFPLKSTAPFDGVLIF